MQEEIENTIETETAATDEIRVSDVTDKDEAVDPVPSSFVDRPLNSAPWQEGERPEAEDNQQ